MKAETCQANNGGKSMITVVNPIYDCVFKYLMEDERIAKTLLTALLKKEVVSVEMRRHEHTNTTRNNISMFRIDFAARVKDENGEEKLMLIELQKTWVETEMLRFRRYLAAQYNAQENMLKVEKGERQFAIPMVAIYLLGHRVGNLKAPVIYVNHDAFNYDGKKVEKGMEDPFIGSLVHDSIIVQLPLLKGKVQNHLEKVLSVFDQINRQPGDKKYINLDESKYEGDEEMMRIIQRLTAATVTADVREEMLVEDEYFSAIENRDTELMEQKKLLEKKDNEIAENKEQLAKKDNEIAENKEQLAKKDNEIAQNKEQLAKKDNEIAQKDSSLITAAKYMLECELPISKIMQATGLTEEQINSLKNNA